jgi:hypothetical protein
MPGGFYLSTCPQELVKPRRHEGREEFRRRFLDDLGGLGGKEEKS